MCGRYTLINTEGIQERFDTKNRVVEVRPSYNVAPGQVMPVITSHSPLSVEMMKWGLIPYWSKDGKTGYSTINARAETVAEKPTYRKAFRSQRCLVPANGFYEWKREGRVKIPYYFRLKDTSLFAMAGLYDIWKDDEGNEHKTYTVITTAANSLMEPVHNRMPVIIPREHEVAWVAGDADSWHLAATLLVPYPSDEMEAYPVSTEVNQVRNNTPDLIKMNSK